MQDDKENRLVQEKILIFKRLVKCLSTFDLANKTMLLLNVPLEVKRPSLSAVSFSIAKNKSYSSRAGFKCLTLYAP